MAASSPVEEVRIMVVDDNPQYRRMLKRFFERESAFVVVGEAADGQEAISLTEKLHPDFVVMDSMAPALRNVCSRPGWNDPLDDAVGA